MVWDTSFLSDAVDYAQQAVAASQEPDPVPPSDVGSGLGAYVGAAVADPPPDAYYPAGADLGSYVGDTIGVAQDAADYNTFGYGGGQYFDPISNDTQAYMDTYSPLDPNMPGFGSGAEVGQYIDQNFAPDQGFYNIQSNPAFDNREFLFGDPIGPRFIQPEELPQQMESYLGGHGLDPSLAYLVPSELMRPSDIISDALNSPGIQGIYDGTSAYSKPSTDLVTPIHEAIGHGIENLLTPSEWQYFNELTRAYPPDPRQQIEYGGAYGPALEYGDRFHSLTQYFDAEQKYGTPIPEPILQFIRDMTPALMERQGSSQDLSGVGAPRMGTSPASVDGPPGVGSGLGNYVGTTLAQQGAQKDTGGFVGAAIADYNANDPSYFPAGYGPASGTGNLNASNEALNLLDYTEGYPNLPAPQFQGIYDPGTGVLRNADNLREQGIATGAIRGDIMDTPAGWVFTPIDELVAAKNALQEGISNTFNFPLGFGGSTGLAPKGEIGPAPILNKGVDLVFPQTPLDLALYAVPGISDAQGVAGFLRGADDVGRALPEIGGALSRGSRALEAPAESAAGLALRQGDPASFGLRQSMVGGGAPDDFRMIANGANKAEIGQNVSDAIAQAQKQDELRGAMQAATDANRTERMVQGAPEKGWAQPIPKSEMDYLGELYSLRAATDDPETWAQLNKQIDEAMAGHIVSGAYTGKQFDNVRQMAEEMMAKANGTPVTPEIKQVAESLPESEKIAANAVEEANKLPVDTPLAKQAQVESDLLAPFRDTPLDAYKQSQVNSLIDEIIAGAEESFQRSPFETSQLDFLGRQELAPGGNGVFGYPEAMTPNVSAATRPMLTDEVSQYIDQWHNNQLVHLDAISQNPEGLLSRLGAVARVASGEYADSYFSSLIRQGENLRTVLSRTGLDPQSVGRIVDGAMQSEVARRFADDIAKKDYGRFNEVISQLADHGKRVQEVANMRGTKLNDLVKGTLFPVDIGVFGNNLQTALRHGNIDMVMGLVHRVAAAAQNFITPDLVPDLYKGLNAANLDKKALSAMDGLAHGAAGSFREPGTGTLLRLVPGLDVIDKYAITPILDALTQFQYGTIMGNVRQMMYEGSLWRASMTGQDISNPAVRQTIAKTVNDLTSAAQTALTPGRSGVEKIATVSPSFFRSRVNTMLDVGKIATGNELERQLGLSILASNAVYLLAMGQVLNDQFGITPFQTDPFKPGFGTITLDHRGSDGRQTVVSLFPQAAFQRVLTQSAQALMNGDPKALGDAWARFAIGQQGVLLRPVTGLLGYGYDREGKLHMGDLSKREALMANIPIPPIANKYLQGERDPTRLGLELLNVPNYGRSMVAEKMDALRTDTAQVQALIDRGVPPEVARQMLGQKFSELGSREKQEREAILNPDDVKRWDDADRKAHNEFRAAMDQQQAIRDAYAPGFQKLEARLSDGKSNPYETRQLIRAAEEAMQAELKAVEFPQGKGDREKSEIQKLQEQYYGLYDKATVNGKVDYELLDRLQAAALAAVKEGNPDLGARLAYNVEQRSNPKDPPILQKLDDLRPLSDKYYDVPEKERAAWRIEHPREEGLLVAYGILGTAHTPQAAQVAASLNGGREPPVTIWIQDGQATPNNVNYPGAREATAAVYGGSWAIKDGDSEQVKQDKYDAQLAYLVANPQVDATLVLAGYSSSVHSMAAYNLVQAGRR